MRADLRSLQRGFPTLTTLGFAAPVRPSVLSRRPFGRPEGKGWNP